MVPLRLVILTWEDLGYRLDPKGHSMVVFRMAPRRWTADVDEKFFVLIIKRQSPECVQVRECT